MATKWNKEELLEELNKVISKEGCMITRNNSEYTDLISACRRYFGSINSAAKELDLEDIENYSCKFCGNIYSSQQGLRIHTTSRHNNKPKVECLECGEFKEVSYYKYESQEEFFCGKECESTYRKRNRKGSDNPRWKEKLKKTCQNCKEEVKIYPSETKWKDKHFCDMECYAEWRSNNIDLSKSNHPRWKEEAVHKGSSNWKTKRREARKRDGQSCVICGKTKAELGTHPHVHHITPFRQFDDKEKANSLENLVTLCPKHHVMLEGESKMTVKEIKNMEVVE